jgi:hypothetical protein
MHFEVCVMRPVHHLDSSVNIVTILRAERDRGWIPRKGKILFSSPQRADRVRLNQPSSQKVYLRLLNRQQSGQNVKLTTHLFYLVQVLKVHGTIPLLLIRPTVWCLIKHRGNLTFLPMLH